MTVQRSSPGIICVVLFILLSLLFIQPVAAQTDPACSARVQNALSQVGNNCADLDVSSACYGHNGVAATFVDGEAGDFGEPSDRVDLENFAGLQTAPYEFNAAGNELTWGVGVIDVPLNIPNAMSGDVEARLIALGDVLLEETTSANDLLELAEEAVAVTITTAANLHVLPGTVPGTRAAFTTSTTIPSFNHLPDGTITTIASGTELLADGISPDGQWVRVLSQFDFHMTGWISRDAFGEEAAIDLDNLPVISPNSRTALQSFQLTTGATAAPCVEANSQLVVTGPRHKFTHFTANNVDIIVDCTSVLRTVADSSAPSGFSLEVAVVSGLAIINPFSPAPTGVAPAYRALIPLDQNADGRFIPVDVNADGFADVPIEIQPMNAFDLNRISVTASLPDNISVCEADPVTVIVGSGVGQPLPIFGITERAAADAQGVCESQRAGALDPRLLPDSVCDTLGF